MHFPFSLLSMACYFLGKASQISMSTYVIHTLRILFSVLDLCFRPVSYTSILDAQRSRLSIRPLYRGSWLSPSSEIRSNFAVSFHNNNCDPDWGILRLKQLFPYQFWAKVVSNGSSHPVRSSCHVVHELSRRWHLSTVLSVAWCRFPLPRFGICFPALPISLPFGSLLNGRVPVEFDFDGVYLHW